MNVTAWLNSPDKWASPAWRGALMMLTTLLLGMSGVVFWQQEQAEEGVQAIRVQLRELFAMESLLVGEIFKLRYGHSNNFDLIDEYLVGEEDRVGIVQGVLADIPDQKGAELAAANLLASLKAKAVALSQFRQEQIRTAEAQQGLSAALAGIFQTPGVSPILAEEAHKLQQSLLYRPSVAETAYLDELPFLIAVLRDAEQEAVSADLRRQIRSAARYAEQIADVSPRLDALTDTLSEPESGVRLRALVHAVELNESDRLARLSRQQLGLGLGVLVLLVVLAWGARKYLQDKRMAGMVLATSPAGIIITDKKGVILSANPAFIRTTGFSAEEVLGNTTSILQSGKQSPEFYRQMWDSLKETGAWQGEVNNRRKNGEIYPEWLSISSVHNDAGEITHYIGVFTDLTELRVAQAHIERMAYHDALTGLPNRTLLRDRAEQHMAEAGRHGRKMGLMFIDLDNFKTINDSLGHGVGDQLLCDVTDRIQSCLRASDTLARYGGDEFILIPRDVESADSLQVAAEKVLECLRAPFYIEGHALSVSGSLGIAVYPDDGVGFDTLLQMADTAMYQAKEEGRDTYRFFEAGMNASARERMQLQMSLHQALDAGEISLHYQPRVDLRSGRILGAEALMRWNSKKYGAISPARFIPVAETSGFILQLGAWALQNACRQAQVWVAAGFSDFIMAVNLSAVQFARADIVGEVRAALQETGLPPCNLELELTESVLVKDLDRTLSLLLALKDLGVRISIDDFGTGYSSLSYLKRFKVDTLKIDQSFVRDLATDPDDAAIIQAIQQLAVSLGMDTIAEGVETEEQRAFLIEAGCQDAQGYLFSKPVTAEAFVEQLKAGRGI